MVYKLLFFFSLSSIVAAASVFSSLYRDRKILRSARQSGLRRNYTSLKRLERIKCMYMGLERRRRSDESIARKAENKKRREKAVYIMPFGSPRALWRLIVRNFAGGKIK